MRRTVLLSACLLTLLLTVPAGSLGATRQATHTQSGVFRVTYAQGKTSDERLLIKLIKASQLSTVAAGLSKTLILPKDVTISITRGQDGPYFAPSTKTIVFNLPFAALMFRVITTEYPKITPYNLGVAFASLEYFILFHEIGHALINLWHIPVLGREEDAVDGFSTIFMTRFVRDGEIALWGADFFNAISGETKNTAVTFADEHSLNAQRAYSIACWVYGSDEKKYSFLAQVIPHSRLVRCPSEYHQLESAWIQFLKPHLR